MKHSLADLKPAMQHALGKRSKNRAVLIKDAWLEDSSQGCGKFSVQRSRYWGVMGLR